MFQLISETIFTGPSAPVIVTEIKGMLSNLEVREYLNACLISLNLIVMIMITRQIWAALKASGWDWRNYPGAIFIACLWWIFLSDFMRACLAWYLLHQQNNNRSLTFLTPTITMLYIAAGVVATVATLRLVYAVSPPEWGHKGWLAALGATILTVAWTIYLD